MPRLMDTDIEHVIGQHSSALQMNDNGECLTLFCGMNRQCIENTYFAHKHIHKATWRSPDSSTNNQIDYICICKRWSSILLDIGTYWVVNVNSDHYLVMASLQSSLKKIHQH